MIMINDVNASILCASYFEGLFPSLEFKYFLIFYPHLESLRTVDY